VALRGFRPRSQWRGRGGFAPPSRWALTWGLPELPAAATV